MCPWLGENYGLLLFSFNFRQNAVISRMLHCSPFHVFYSLIPSQRLLFWTVWRAIISTWHTLNFINFITIFGTCSPRISFLRKRFQIWYYFYIIFNWNWRFLWDALSVRYAARSRMNHSDSWEIAWPGIHATDMFRYSLENKTWNEFQAIIQFHTHRTQQNEIRQRTNIVLKQLGDYKACMIYPRNDRYVLFVLMQ